MSVLINATEKWVERRAFSGWIRPAWLSLLLALAVAGCADKRQTWTHSAKGYTLAVRTSPEPLQAGKNAEITAVLHYQNKPQLADCPIRFRQYPRGRQPTDKDKYHDMHQALTSGIYRGESGVFTTPEVWIVDFDIKCHDEKVNMQFPFHVKLTQ